MLGPLDNNLCLYRRKPEFPGSLTDLHRYRKTVHGHDGDSRIVMVRKTDERTFASIEDGQEPQLETITRETVETFRGQRTELKVTTEKKEKNDKVPADLLEILSDHLAGRVSKNGLRSRKASSTMDFQLECLKIHNDFRAKHGVPPLKLNPKISKFSQDWANTLLRRNTLEHSKNREYGENLFFMSSSNPNFTVTGSEPVKSWYDEIKGYAFGAEPRDLRSGHFTQVVWKQSREIGIGIAQKNGRVYVVANYYPPGNIIGYFTENVPPPGGLHRETNNNEPLEKSFNRIEVSERRGTPTHVRGTHIIGTEGNFEEDFLKAHNEYRSRHGVPPLKLDRKMCKYAEEWAKILAAKNILEHRKNCPYGENIYSMYSSDPNFKITGHTPVDTWYEEVRFYPFGREPNDLKSGHFTQVVWKSSEFLGVGVAKSRQGSIYVVANYSPAGNFVGSFAENVPPPISMNSGPSPPIHESPSRDYRFLEKPRDGDFTQFQLDMLRVHNEYRRKHTVPELVLSKELCDFAQEWANHCIKTGNMAPRPNNVYGENLFAVYSSDFSHVPSARDAVKEWYDEVKEHVYGKETLNFASLHFSQIVWKNTRELGVGVAQNQKGQTIVVANYSPRGNVFGQFGENVSRPRI